MMNYCLLKVHFIKKIKVCQVNYDLQKTLIKTLITEKMIVKKIKIKKALKGSKIFYKEIVSNQIKCQLFFQVKVLYFRLEIYSDNEKNK